MRICKIVDCCPGRPQNKSAGMWTLQVTIVPIVIGALSTITKGLLKSLADG